MQKIYADDLDGVSEEYDEENVFAIFKVDSSENKQSKNWKLSL
jgi:hypothetical protein